MDNIKSIHELSFVFVDSLDLNIEETLGIDFEIHIVLDPLG